MRIPINRRCHEILSAIRPNKTFPSALVILLICVSSVTILYKIFFRFSEIIWSVNKEIHLEDLTPAIRDYVMERDGIETYCLYALVFACILLSFLILFVYRILSSSSKSPIYKISYFFLFLSLLLNVGLFFGNIGFTPPMYYAILNLWVYFIAIIVSVIAYFLFKFLLRFEKISACVVSIMLIPVCFIATTPMALVDYSFIFAPALRIIHHFKISEIYFQYDLLLSFLAALWMKLDIDLNYFQVLGQFSVYLFLLAAFFFSKRLFLRKELSLYLMAALVLIKIYANIGDPVLYFQVTPLRLDWWLLLVILAYEKGLYSKWTGLALGALILLHRTFGIIYAIGYLETVIMLLIFDCMRGIQHARAIKTTLKEHFKCNIGNAVIIVSSMGIGLLWFGSSLESAAMYQKIGIGFLPILKTSFYWYVPVMLSAASIYLLALRGKLPDGYFTTGSFLVFLAIGNSIYFFGRSHENNIINISGSLVLALFMLFDLLALKYKCPSGDNALKKMPVIMLPNVFLLLLLLFYSGKIYSVTEAKLDNIRKFQFIYPMESSFDMKQIKELTGGSSNVYFVGDYDFYYYYYGGYVSQGRFSPCAAWVYKKDLVGFLQSLIDKGYYVVLLRENNINPKPYEEILAELKYDGIKERDGFKAVWKHP